MSQEITLKPCPFCGSCDYKLFNIVKPYYIYCIHCRTHGPETNQGNQQAAELWNTRPQAEALNELERKIIDASLLWVKMYNGPTSIALADAIYALIEARAAQDKERAGST